MRKSLRELHKKYSTGRWGRTKKDEVLSYPTPAEHKEETPTASRPSTSDTSGQTTHPPRFALLSVEEILALPDPKWVVDEFIPSPSLAQLYGASGVGKTFVALDVGLSVAAGIEWLGTHEVTQGPVVYVAAEGHRGMKTRVGAWLQHHGREVGELEDFRLIAEALPLANPRDVAALIQQVDETFPERDLALLVLDTQARCTEGLDENSSKEMGLAVAAADRLKRSTGAAVLLIHHTGYEKYHARGSTAVQAALDSQAVIKGATQALTLTCEKQKDAEEFDPIRIALIPVGDSLVPVADTATSPVRLQIARQALAGMPEEALSELRKHPTGLSAKEWLEASGLKRSTFFDVRNVLVEKGLVDHRDRLYFAVELESGESDFPKSKSNQACSGEVQRSTPPLGGGLMDSDASEEEENDDDEVDRLSEAIECASTESSRTDGGVMTTPTTTRSGRNNN